MLRTKPFHRKWGVTGQIADHPLGATDLLLWIDIIYKIILVHLRFSMIQSSEKSQKPFFNEIDLQNTAFQLTTDLLKKDAKGEFIYLKDFFRRYASIPVERKTYLMGIIKLRHIIHDFLGGE
ncbi:MAG: hypothetical protein GXO76_13875 [Calditrichaeota bacterium]|nr:hypothetical protein [Calditrichota bacterium]